MNLVLVHCGKEWRAQRALLVAYALLVFGCLCLGFLLLPKAWWQQEENGAFALAWFVAAGVFGVVAFAAPALVKGEFGPKGDQFVRRLPGALGASFGGKLLFLVLAAVALPLLGLLWGELFLQAAGHDWNGLFRWNWDGTVWISPPWIMLWCAFALLLTPWVWAAGTALPGGRMAVGGAILLVLLVGLGVVPVLRQHPRLELGIAWQGWLWAVAPVGLTVAGLAWMRGRRGGGALRSARIAGAATLVSLVPPGLWLGAEAWRYRHPDPAALPRLDVRGMTPDGRWAVVQGNAFDWPPVTFRIDLATGAVERVAGIDGVLLPAQWQCSSVTRWWIDHNGTSTGQDWYDLASGERTALQLDERDRRILTPEQKDLLAAAARESSRWRAPGSRRLWIDGQDICMEGDAGSVRRWPLPEPAFGARAEGHGLVVHTRQQAMLFDPSSFAFVPLPPNRASDWLLVGEVLLFQERPREWMWQSRYRTMPCTALRGARLLGLVDDEWVLFAVKDRTSSRLFLFRPSDGSERELATLPERAIEALAPLGMRGSMLPRDPAGRIWLRVGGGHPADVYVLDASSLVLSTAPLLHMWWWEDLEAWPDADSALVTTRRGGERATIERIDLGSGTRTVLFPRSR